MRLTNMVAVVTGSAQGIGKGIALQMAREGANIVVADKNLDGARQVEKEIRALRRKAMSFQLDVSRSPEVNALFKAALEKFGQIDVLVNNAGGTARERATLFCQSTEEVWDYVLGINLKGVLNCSRAVINHMIERKRGVIINIASIAGVVGSPGRADYSAAKGGIIAFTKALALEVAGHGVRVVSISPHTIETPRPKNVTPEYAKYKAEQFQKLSPLGRIGYPEDIAHMAVFLASGEASYITGHNFVVDGGSILKVF